MILANWNGIAHIARCLDGVFAQTHPAAEVVVVDNGSTDGSPEMVRARYPGAQVIPLSRNEGIPRAWNLGIRHTRSPYILILNTDAFLDRDFLCAALRAVRQAPDIGTVAARVHDADTGRVADAGVYLKRRIASVNSRNVSEPEFVFAGSGAAIFCRRSMLEDVAVFGEVFDESFFANWEDKDLAWRAHLRGWRCLYAPGAVVRHVGSAAQGGSVRVVDKPAFFQRHIWKNRYLTLTKNASAGVLLALSPWLVLAELLSWLYILARIPRRLPVFWGAHVDYVRLVPDALKKRRYIQRRRKSGARRILRFFRGF